MLLLDVMSIFFSLLSFLIVFGILERIRVFPKKINLVISILIALSALLSFYHRKEEATLLFSLLGILIIASFLISVFLRIKKKHDRN